MKNFTFLLIVLFFASNMFAQQQKKDDFQKQHQLKSHEKTLTGLITTSSFYIPNSTMDLEFVLNLSSIDEEFGDYIQLTFPSGIIPITGTPVINPGGQDGGEALNPIAGQVISWGDNDNYWGGIEYDSYIFTVKVSVGNIVGSQNVNYFVSGDSIGETPHSFTGTCIITEAPPCVYPKDLNISNLTTNSATLNWTEQANSTLWNVEWGISGFIQGSGTKIDSLTNQNTQISNLTESTSYDFYVQTDCGTEQSTWVGPFTFRTAASLPFSEDFETNIDDWSNIDNDNDGKIWYRDTLSNYHSGKWCLTSASFDGLNSLTPDNWIISPAIDLSTATGSGELTLKYWVAPEDQLWPSEHYKVVVSTTGSESISNFTDILFEETLTTGDAVNNFYFERTINLNAYAGQTINIAWVHYNCTNIERINIDDISIYENIAIDVAVNNIVAPTNETGCSKASDETIIVTITNLGGASISNFDIDLKLNNQLIATETITSSISPSQSIDYTFTKKLDLSTLGYYSLQASVSVLGDIDSSNDLIKQDISSTDGEVTITVSSDNVGGQNWYILNSLNDTIATHGDYVSNTTTIDNICVIDNDCYTLNWKYANVGTNNLSVAYNGITKETVDVTTDYSIGMIGGCPNEVEIIENDNLSIYPNPSSGIVNITTTENSTICIYNLLGDKIFNITQSETNNYIDLSEFPKGVYLIKVLFSNNKQQIKKLNLIN